MQYYWIKCTEHEISTLRRATKGVALIPLASIESHGPHMPLGADSLQADYVVDKVIAIEPVAVLPTMHYSYVAAARMLPGAIHIPSDLLMQFVEQVCDEVYRNGFDKIILFHGHGGNVALHWMFAQRMLEREKPYSVYSIPPFGGKWDEVAALFKGAGDLGHACAMEASLSMVACPELVNLKALGKKTFPERSSPKVGAAHTPVEWISRHPEMAVGTPQKADRAKGQKVLQLWVDDTVSIIRKVKRDRLVAAEMARYARQAQSLRKGGKRPARSAAHDN